MNRWAKWAGYAAGTGFGLVLVTAGGVYGVSESRYRKAYPIVEQPVVVAGDSAAIARGKHIAESFGGCNDCHGDNLAGKEMINDPAIGRVHSANLTSGKGGVARSVTDVQLARAIRHGIGKDDRALKIMPSSDFMNLSDQDLGALISYLRSLPPVDNETPLPTVGPVGRALYLAGQLPFLHAERIDHARPHVAAVTPSRTAEYGSYIASIGCKGCHGASLAGGKIVDAPPGWPWAANLTPAGNTKDWTEQDFRRLLREGKRPNGTSVNEVMPWRMTKQLTDDEIGALVLYLRTLPPTPTPGLETASK